jgi:hypothetical protein
MYPASKQVIDLKSWRTARRIPDVDKNYYMLGHLVAHAIPELRRWDRDSKGKAETTGL